MTPTREEAFRRQRALALFCALQAFQRNLMCVWIRRPVLLTYLGLDKIVSDREAWIREDFKPWFPSYRVFGETERSEMVDRHFFSKFAIEIVTEQIRSVRTLDTFRKEVSYATPESATFWKTLILKLFLIPKRLCWKVWNSTNRASTKATV